MAGMQDIGPSDGRVFVGGTWRERREKGRQGLRAWTRQKSFYLGTSGQPHPWTGLAA
ncbi:MAG TPA: hypothetical protein VIL69_08205 [Roseomonas sp.]|jgi:hypothetical protein